MNDDLVKELRAAARRDNPLVTWQTIIAVIATAAITTAVQWGLFIGKIADLERRMEYMESQHYIPGIEGVDINQFREFREDIIRRLGRIEEKQDQEIRKNR